MRKTLALVILVIAIAALSVTPAFAAKGVITEVNPSGINTVDQENNPTGNDPGQQGSGQNGNAGEGHANRDGNGNSGDQGLDEFGHNTGASSP
jgi:hypothetical protein